MVGLLMTTTIMMTALHCTMYCLYSLSSLQLNKLRHMIFEETVTNSKFAISWFWVFQKWCFQCSKIKSKTSFKVFILKKHRKNNLKNNFPHGKLFLFFFNLTTGLSYCTNSTLCNVVNYSHWCNQGCCSRGVRGTEGWTWATIVLKTSKNVNAISIIFIS